MWRDSAHVSSQRLRGSTGAGDRLTNHCLANRHLANHHLANRRLTNRHLANRRLTNQGNTCVVAAIMAREARIFKMPKSEKESSDGEGCHL